MGHLTSRWQVWGHKIWRVLGGVSVRTKILGMVLALVLFLGLAMTLQVRALLTHTLREQLQERSISIARDIAARSADLLPTNNLSALHRLLYDTRQHNPDVRYALFVDSDGRVLAHTFEGGVPPELVRANPLPPGRSFHLTSRTLSEGIVWDAAVPVSEGRTGLVRVGLSEQSMWTSLSDVTWQLLTTTLLVSVVGTGAAIFLTWLITHPVLELVKVTRAVARGDLTRQASRWADDEIGLLGDSFNAMIHDLAVAQAESEAFDAELLRRNRELAVLNEVARAVSGQHDLNKMLRNALQRVLDLLSQQGGWVLLLGEDEARLACAVGLPVFASGEQTIRFPDCQCGRVLEEQRSLIIDPQEKHSVVIKTLGELCPVRGLRLADGQIIDGHITAPLIAKAKVLGMLNIACNDPESVSEDDLQLLGAIGRQLGVAVENARLWEEVRQKEIARGHLLEKIIAAQEEERKRIARELHDETGQALASLAVGLRNAEEAATPQETNQRLAELRGIVARTLSGVRRLSFDLRPTVLDDLGLVAALRDYAQRYQARFDISTEVQTVGLDGQRLSPEVETTIYRIVQETMTNAAKYAQCAHISVLLQIRDDQLYVIVEDDGCGFDVAQVFSREVGQTKLGFYGMQERAELIGGHLDVESQPGASTAIYLSVPLEAQEGS